VVFSSNIIAYVFATHDFEADEIECRSKHRQEYARQKSASGGNQPSPPANSETDPEKIARDYCVQRRSAIAGETQAEVAKLAAGVSFLALLSAIAAVAIAVWAAEAARDTVTHAASQADSAKEAARAAAVSATTSGVSAVAAQDAVRLEFISERAHVFLEHIAHNSEEWRHGQKHFIWEYRFANHGKTPTIIQRMRASAVISREVPAPSDEEPTLNPAPTQHPWGGEPKNLIIPALSPTRSYLSIAGKAPLQRGGADAQTYAFTASAGIPGHIGFWLVGQVDYNDIFGFSHVTEFCLRVDRPMPGVSEAGPSERNRRT
jgi:hypothetical protein